VDVMNLERRKKYQNQGRTAVQTDKKIDINFDLNALNLMCVYVLSENRNIRRSHLINMRNLFEIIDLDLYINDIEKMKRVNFIKKGLEGKLLHNLKNSVIVMKYINGGLMDDDIIDINNFVSLSNEELMWINETVSESLNYAFIYNDIDKMIDVCTRFKAADYRSRGVIVDEIQGLINDMQTKFRRTRVQSLSEVSFCLKQGLMEEVVADIHEQLTSPSRRLITGMQGLNELLGGGFESTRVYMLLGLTGVGKSVTLLNIAYQIKKYNKSYKPKDPTKIPAILYVTMENTVAETVDRLFTMSTTADDMKNHSKEDVINMLRTEGELFLTDSDPIDIVIKFVPDRSVDTGYLYTMVEDLEDEGYEVIALVQDHIKKIRSAYKHNDIRLELGSIVNEFKVFSALKDMPVITNSHLNREAARVVDEGRKHNKADLTRMLGRANVGESMLMIDNLDCAFLIGLEFDAQGNKYMAFNRIKMRYKATNRDYICHPFVPGNGIKLVEDYYLQVPVFKDSLKVQPEESSLYNAHQVQRKEPAYASNIRDIDDILTNKTIDDDVNIFTASRYMSQPNITQIYLEEDNVIDVETMPALVAGKRSTSTRELQPMVTFKRDVA